MKKSLSAVLAALLLLAAVDAKAAGLFPGFPAAGFPLTGNETLPADTNLSGGQNPQTELITPGKLAGYFRATVVMTESSTGTFTPDLSQGILFQGTLSNNNGNTINTPINGQSGQFFTLLLTQDATGSRTVAWQPAYLWQLAQASQPGTASAPTQSTPVGYTDLYAFWYDGTSFYNQSFSPGIH